MTQNTLAELNQARQADKDESTKDEVQETSGSDSNITSAEFLLIGGLALIKDAVDVIITLSIIGVILQVLVNIPITLMLWLWCVSRLKRFPTVKFLGTAGLECIPFLGALPLWTGFVIALWLKQTGYLPKWLSRTKRAKAL